ncbi:hypothetical protein KM043_014774 [Ampulex compressa]|nr:hypothetical protein KM043_014774 [Ampulex compressa]
MSYSSVYDSGRNNLKTVSVVYGAKVNTSWSSKTVNRRPRGIPYNNNLDSGEVHLTRYRKYSGRPLFSEPRTSLADEIAARRSDIGTRDLSGPRNSSFGRDLDLELDPRTRASPLAPQSSLTTDPLLLPEDEETVYDSRGQRTRRRFADDFADEVATTTRRFKAKLSAMGLEEDVESALGRRPRADQDPLEGSLGARKAMQTARSAIEEAESSFKRRSKLFDEIDRMDEGKPSLARWSKLVNEDDDLVTTSSAATRAKQTKARLNDLETEMEEMAERQAKRERRAAALRALVNESTMDDSQQAVVSSKKVSVRNERTEKHVAF